MMFDVISVVVIKFNLMTLACTYNIIKLPVSFAKTCIFNKNLTALFDSPAGVDPAIIPLLLIDVVITGANLLRGSSLPPVHRFKIR